MLCWCFIHYPFSIPPPSYFLFSSKSLQVKSDSRQLLPQRHHRLWYSLELWGPSPPLRHLQAPHVERTESSLPAPRCLLSCWYKHLFNMSISRNNGPDYPDPVFTEMKRVFEIKSPQSAVCMRMCVSSFKNGGVFLTISFNTGGVGFNSHRLSFYLQSTTSLQPLLRHKRNTDAQWNQLFWDSTKATEQSRYVSFNQFSKTAFQLFLPSTSISPNLLCL